MRSITLRSHLRQHCSIKKLVNLSVHARSTKQHRTVQHDRFWGNLFVDNKPSPLERSTECPSGLPREPTTYNNIPRNANASIPHIMHKTPVASIIYSEHARSTKQNSTPQHVDKLLPLEHQLSFGHLGCPPSQLSTPLLVGKSVPLENEMSSYSSDINILNKASQHMKEKQHSRDNAFFSDSKSENHRCPRYCRNLLSR